MTITDRRLQATATQSRMSFEEYLTYDDGTDARYELVDGVLVEMNPPTWLHLRIARYLEGVFNAEIERLGYPWEAFRESGQQTNHSGARIADVAVVKLEAVEGVLEQSAVLTGAAVLIVEVVSDGTATQDYREKVREYEQKGVQEYWIVDPDPFGAAKYIGSPKRPTVSIYTLWDGAYQVQRCQGDAEIFSPTFPGLKLTAALVLNAGKRPAGE
jgi:Uma2 family endonuclease